MASRQEEKERLRRERQEQEAKEASAAKRARTIQMAGGALLVLAVAAVAGLLLLGGGDDKDSGPTVGGIPAAVASTAKAAGCVAKSYPNFGREHTESKVTYKTNPPTSGNHNPTPAQDGIYDPGNTPAKENFVHTLEHGRIELQYKPGAPASVRSTLEKLFNEKNKGTSGYHELLFENTTNMPYEVAATSWTKLLGCPQMNARVPAAIRAFRDAFTDKGPEFIP